MVISESRRFLFVHIYKAAGMSIEAALKPYDLRTDLAGETPEAQRRQFAARGFNPAILDMQRHTFAHELRDALGAALFSKLFKFAFVRNPWDLQLSLYHFNLAHPEFPAHRKAAAAGSFEAYILTMEPKPHPVGQQRQFIVDRDGTMLVDFVGRFENLAADFAQVCARLDLGALTLGHANRTDHAPWTRSYSREMFDRVRAIHAKDIATFSYADDPAVYGIS